MPYIGKRAGYLILRFIAVARANFLPSVTHPDHIADYANRFDIATARAWLMLVQVPTHDPLADWLLRMRYVPTVMGGSGIPRVTETAPA